MVRENLKALHELQAIDTRVLEVERIAAVLPEKIRLIESEVEGMRAELGALNTELETKKKEQREIEAQIKEETEKHKKWKRRLNEIKTPREYQAMSREIELGERQVRDFEETVLLIMTEVEGKQKVVSDKEGDLRQREMEVAAKVREHRIRQAELAKDAAKIAEGRIAITKQVPENIMKRYEQVRERRNGIAVSVVVEGLCSACNVQLRPQQVVDMRKYTSIMQCSQCNRILVPDELVKEKQDQAQG